MSNEVGFETWIPGKDLKCTQSMKTLAQPARAIGREMCRHNTKVSLLILSEGPGIKITLHMPFILTK